MNGKRQNSEGLRRDGTELSSGILSTVMKTIRGQSSKRPQSRERRQEKMCSGMHNQEYPIPTRGIFPSTPQGLPRPFWEMTVSQHTKKSLEQLRNKKQRERIQEVLKKPDELGEEVFCG